MHSTAAGLTVCLILGAVAAQPAAQSASDPLRILPPELAVPVPALEVPAPPVFPETRQALQCRDMSGRVASMESSILNVKARYWAAQLRRGELSTDNLRVNPGSEILDPGLRRVFYKLLKTYYRDTTTRRPSQFDIHRMVRTMRRMLELIRSCGGDAPDLERAIRQTRGGGI